MDLRNSAEVVDLSAFDEDYARATTIAFGDAPGDDVPDGSYDVRVEDVSLSRTTNTANPMLIWKLRILGPKCEGHTLTKVRVVTNKTLPYVKSDLVRLGMNLDRFSDLNSRLGEMMNLEIGVYKRTQPDRRWIDIYITRGCAPLTRSDDVPF